MKSILKIFIMSLIIGSIISVFIYNRIEKKYSIESMNIQLSNLTFDLKILQKLEKEDDTKKSIAEEIDWAILSRVSQLSISDVKINDLNGSAFKSLYTIVLLNKSGNFGYYAKNAAFDIYRNYLNEIEDEVLERYRSEESQKMGQLDKPEK